jgi:alpha-1,4-digalacturonate transport system permease protein
VKEKVEMRAQPIRIVFHDVAAIVVCAIFLLPVIWAVASAFKPSEELFEFPPSLFPHHPTLQSFQNIFSTGDVLRYALNSFLVAVGSSLITLLISSMAGFALAKYRFPGQKILFLLIIGMLLVPLQVLMIPVFLVLKTLGWVNSLLGIIIPPAATPTGTFMLRQFILGIPDELIEAARLDGASDWKIYWHVILPLSAPVLAALGILSFTWRWNDYIWPLIAITSQDRYTLQLALANLIGTNTVEWGTLLAYATSVLLPVLVVFVIFQRYFLKGNIAGGVKG